MLALALHDGSLPARKKDIAESEGLSPDYAEQILMRLRQAGLVTSFRGAKGGFVLARPADRISVAEVLEAMEGPIIVAPCAQNTCRRSSSCVTREVWDRAGEALRQVLGGVRLSDMAARARDLNASPVLAFEI
jgi:Rrf2 family protein